MLKKLVFISTLLFFIFLQGCLPTKSPEITYSDTVYRFNSFQYLDTEFKFNIKNENSVALKGNIDYDLFLDDSHFLTGQSSDVTVGPDSTVGFSINTQIDFLKIYDTASKIIADIMGGKTDIPFRLTGTFKTSAMLIPINVPLKVEGEIPLPKLSDIKL